MDAEKILQLIPPGRLKFLAAETQVDFQVKKLSGEVIFKLILLSMLNEQRLSLRVLEAYTHSAQFHFISGSTTLTTRYNSLRDRIATIKVSFFEKIFTTLFAIYNKALKEEHALIKADSTYVTVSAKLVKWSMQTGDKADRMRQYKIAASLKGSLPFGFHIYTEQKYVSESLALGTHIEQLPAFKDSIITFDRGLQSRKTFEALSASSKRFVGRLLANARYKVLKTSKVPRRPASSTVTVVEDIHCQLYNKQNQLTQGSYRIVKAISNASGEDIHFITNCQELSCYEIAFLYKQRWQIELFFKFLKQHLNLKHLLCRQENGIKVMLYMTMIAAMLVLVYKKANNIPGYKIARLKFEIELDKLLIKEIVLFCGGNPQLINTIDSS